MASGKVKRMEEKCHLRAVKKGNIASGLCSIYVLGERKNPLPFIFLLSQYL